MSKSRPILLLCLFAYCWAVSGWAGVAWASLQGSAEHHEASVQYQADGVALVLSHHTHHDEHDEAADAGHIAAEHQHADHVLKLPSQADSNLSTGVKDLKAPKALSLSVLVTVPVAELVLPPRVTGGVRAPPVSRTTPFLLKQTSVLLI